MQAPQRRIAVGSVVAGVAMLSGSAFSHDWTSNLLLNLGTSVLLIVPVLLISTRLERDLQLSEERTRVQTQVLSEKIASVEESSARSLESIRAAFQERQDQRKHHEDKLIDDLTKNPGFSAVAKALEYYTLTGTLSQSGVRLKVGEPDIWANVKRQSSSSVVFEFQRKHGESMFNKIWYSTDEVEVFLDKVVGELVRTGGYDPRGIDPGVFLTELRQLLLVSRSTRLARAGDDLGPVKQYCAPQWLLYDKGIGTVSGEGPYFFPYTRLHHLNWRQQVGDKTWVNYSSLDDAITLAEDLGLGRSFEGYENSSPAKIE